MNGNTLIAVGAVLGYLSVRDGLPVVAGILAARNRHKQAMEKLAAAKAAAGDAADEASAADERRRL